MAIVKRKNSKFWYIVIRKNGKQLWVSTDTEDENKAKEKELELRQTQLKHKDEKKWTHFVENVSGKKQEEKGLLISKAWDFFHKKFCDGLAPSTVYRKKREWETFTEWLIKTYPTFEKLHDINYNVADEYSTHLLSGGVSNYTHNLSLSKVKEVLERLSLPAGIPKNPFDYVKYKRASHISFRCLTRDEIKKLLSCASQEWKTAILVAFYTGLDLANIKVLKWSDIKNDVISVYRIKTKSRGTGIIHIPLHPRLKKHLDSTKHEGLEYILPDKFRQRHKTSEFNKLLNKCKIKADGHNVGFHSLRHTFNTELEHSNIDIGTRQKLTGHSTADMNMIYSHAMKPLKDAVNKLPSL